MKRPWLFGVVASLCLLMLPSLAVAEVPPNCGDGIIQWRAGEECELGVGNECGSYAECVDCQCVSGRQHCGNGVIDWKLGEECDPPGEVCGVNDTWRCSEGCLCERVSPSKDPELHKHSCYYFEDEYGNKRYVPHNYIDENYHCFKGVLVPNEYFSEGFIGKETVGRVTDTSVTISLVPFSKNMTVKAVYGANPGDDIDDYSYETIEITNLETREPLEITIDNLVSSTQYYYRVLAKKEDEESFNVREEGSFHTKREAGDSFTFAITSDIHTFQIRDKEVQKNIFRSTLQNIKNDNPDFHIDLGDTFITDFADPSKDIRSQREAYTNYEEVRKYFDEIHSSVPFFFVLGNHEGELGYAYGDLAQWSENARLVYVPNPQTDSVKENYYAFAWGDGLFIMLDPFRYINKYGGWILGPDQSSWLLSKLQNSQEKYIFLFTHHLTGGCNKYGRGGAQCAYNGHWGNKVHPALIDLVNGGKKVIVFHGHDHAFGDETLDGIRYTLVPSPQTVVKEWAFLEGFYNLVDLEHNPGHVRVSVDDTYVLVEYVDATTGATKYSYIEDNHDGYYDDD